MQAKRYPIAAVLFLCLALTGLTGCSKSAKAPSSDNPAAASQTDAAADDGASNQSPATPAPEPLVIPAGTSITVRLQQGLSSASAVRGESFDAVIDEPVVVGERVVVPVGALATGHVVVARHSGRLHHPGKLGLALDSVTVGQQNIPLATSSVVVRGRSHKKRNWAFIGGGTGGGALIGALAAGGKGTLIGGAIGAAAGTTTAFVTGKKDVVFGSERRLRFRLNHDVAVSG